MTDPLEARPGRAVTDVALFLPSLAGGGAERVTLNLARGLIERGLSVDLVIPNASGELSGSIPVGARLVDFGGLRTLRSVPNLTRYLRRHKPSALLSAMNHANMAAAWSAKFAGFKGKLVLAEHIQLPKPSASLWQRAFNVSVSLSYRFADTVVAVSEGVKGSLVDNARVPRDKIKVVFNPVISDDLDRYKRYPRPELLNDVGDPVFLGIGRLDVQKNFPLLIRSFAAYRASRPAQLVILGEGSERARLENLALELGVSDSVHLPGFVNDPFAYLANADVFVLSSNWEGLPTVLIEALTVGTQIVSTDCPSGPREILDEGAYGRLVDMEDEIGLSEAMAAALADPLTVAPDEWVSQFGVRAATTNYIQVLGLLPVLENTGGS